MGCVEALQIRQRQRVDEAGSIRRAIHRGVMDHDEVPVGRGVHVEFQRVSAVGDGRGEGIHRARRRFEFATLVRHVQGTAPKPATIAHGTHGG